MSESIVQIITDGVYIAVFVLVLIDFLRFRDILRFNVAVLFGLLAAIIAVQGVTRLLPVSAPWAGTVTALLLLSQPYVMLRLLEQFQRVPRLQHVIAVVGLVASWGLVISAGPSLPVWATVSVVLAFVYVELYSTFVLIRGALTTHGLTQLRLFAVAVGSGLLGLIILLAGLGSLLPAWRDFVAASTGLLGLSSALSYYAGFATPRWLRKVWQRAELHQFLLGLSRLPGSDAVASALDYLAPSAARVSGGKLAVVALADQDDSRLRLHLATIDPELELVPLGLASPILDRVWREQRPAATFEPSTWGATLRRFAHAAGGARGALMAPLTTDGQRYGLLVVLVERGLLFAQDDLEMLSLLAQQAALAIERRRLMAQAERERARLLAVMSSQSDGILLLDETGRIQYCNAKAEALLRQGAEALVGSTPQDAFAGVQPTLTSGSALGELESALTRAAERPSFELQFQGSPGGDLLVQVFDVTQPAGAHYGMCVMLRDVTAERDLARTKDELVSVVSHELRTPLASVVGFAELLLARPGMAEAPRQQYLGVMVEEGRRLTALINDFLDLQRLESGRHSGAARPTDLLPILEQSVIAVGEDPERPIVVEVGDELPVVRANADRVRQVLGNLLSNARKYSPNGGLIRLDAAVVDGQVCVSVEDHGLGLPTSALSRLFEKFYRVDNSDRREITGTGLGLAISRRIIEGNGGRIWAESAGLGTGSRFRFTLPIAAAPVGEGEVLVVEDDANFAKLLVAALAEKGLSAVCAASAEEALQQVTVAPPRVIVLDLLLPDMQGVAFLSQLREAHGFADLPVVVVTVKDLTTEEKEVLAGLRVHTVLRKGSGVAAATAGAVTSAIGGSFSQLAAYPTNPQGFPSSA